jgi:ADP-ribose pyrophosphatase YjhB (NUDIX family)
MVKFCAHCGGRLAVQWLDSEQRRRQVCTACSKVHYENPRILVSCYAHWRDSVVFCRRAQAPARGLWALPAGFVEKGETLEEAVVREVAEETGLDLGLQPVALFRVTSLPHMNEVYVEYRVELPAAPVFAPGPEALEVALFAESDLPRDQLAFGDMLCGYPDDFYQCLRSARFPVTSISVRLPANAVHW